MWLASTRSAWLSVGSPAVLRGASRMKLLRPCLGALLAAGLFLVPTNSEAAVRVGLGADYWIDDSAVFNFTLGVETPLAGPLSVGARFGAMLITEGNDIGVPLDLVLRANLAKSGVYIEGMVGPWLVFGRGDTFRAHAAFGFGLQGKAASIGLEVGYLEPNPTIGLRLGYKF
ncbi:hypothetical protein BHS07_37330 [Myxococcus xanthus]|uniref:Outer membrane protein beta-barrel domain-containing protein n=1 Tax=Myxococcus xanthus TaxID=34 RepID=A0AAE6G6Z9_MYXXA|nr:hypothetical protein BHS09_36775 [Myxococcus xanthus]QDE80051.1 hypothetical protein BHS08_36800 [Myxococcus xanthus]QDE87432.1 hypothetical protein BHS07_37330 [Myxococcus xanthus]